MLENIRHMLSLKMTYMYEHSKCPCMRTAQQCSDFLPWWQKNLFSSVRMYWAPPAWWALWGAEVDRPFLWGAHLLAETSHCRCWQILRHGFILGRRLEKSSQTRQWPSSTTWRTGKWKGRRIKPADPFTPASQHKSSLLGLTDAEDIFKWMTK